MYKSINMQVCEGVFGECIGLSFSFSSTIRNDFALSL